MNKFLAVTIMTLGGCVLPLFGGLIANATFRSTQIDPTDWQYTLTLNNTGTTTIGTFWFSWIPGQDYMPTSPSSITGPTGWTSTVTAGGAGDGYAIQWVTATNLLGPGNSVSGFGFDSATTPAQMAGLSLFHNNPPVGTSFVYIAAPLGDPGFSFVATATTTGTPEPSSLLLLTAGIGLLGWKHKRVAANSGR
jgi:hypothetical protein